MKKEDIVNMFCGQFPEDYYAMAKVTKLYGDGLYNWDEKGGHFKWRRERIAEMPTEAILKLYNQIQEWNKGEKKIPKKKILAEVRMKKCYCGCPICGYNEVAEEDLYCAKCGIKLQNGW